MSKFTRKSIIAAALAVGVGAVGPRAVVWAQDKTADDHKKMTDDHMDRMKMMAAGPAQTRQMTADLARMMVMDRMAMQMAMDPTFKAMATQSMNDANMKKVHDDAKAMADDPAQMARIRQEVTADPKAMESVMHMANRMAMMHGGAMKDMHDDSKMKDTHNAK
jgi:hypothetical protein